MTQVTVDIDLNDTIGIEGVIEEFKNFASIVSTAINIHHAKASRLEALGITAGRYQREVIESIGNTISALMPS